MVKYDKNEVENTSHVQGLTSEQNTIIERATLSDPEDMKLLVEFDSPVFVENENSKVTINSMDIIISCYSFGFYTASESSGKPTGYIFSYILNMNLVKYDHNFDVVYHYMASEDEEENMAFGLLKDENPNNLNFKANLIEFLEIFQLKSKLSGLIHEKSNQKTDFSIQKFHFQLGKDLGIRIENIVFKCHEYHIKLYDFILNFDEGSIDGENEFSMTFNIGNKSKICIHESNNIITFKDSYILLERYFSEEYYFFNREPFKFITEIFHNSRARIHFNSTLHEYFTVEESTISEVTLIPSYGIQMNYNVATSMLTVDLDRFIHSTFKWKNEKFEHVEIKCLVNNSIDSQKSQKFSPTYSTNVLNISKIYKYRYDKELLITPCAMKAISQNINIDSGFIEYCGIHRDGRSIFRIDLFKREEPEFFLDSIPQNVFPMPSSRLFFIDVTADKLRNINFKFRKINKSGF